MRASWHHGPRRSDSCPRPPPGGLGMILEVHWVSAAPEQRMTWSCLSVTRRHSAHGEEGSMAHLPGSALGSEPTTACTCGHVTAAMTPSGTISLRFVGCS